MFWQIIILTDQFNQEDEVIKELPHILKGAAEPLARVYPEVYELLPTILKTKRVSEHINGGIINDKAIQDFASKVYLVTFPPSLQGLTLFNGYIAIKRRSPPNPSVITGSVYKGFTLFTALHEYGHFMQRLNLNTSMKWLDHESPRCKKIKKCEAGTELRTKIFHCEPQGINDHASLYAMNIDNWRKRTFITNFHTLNNKASEDIIRDGVVESARLSQTERSHISLIGCCKGNREGKKIDIINY